jgi:hypothetical protein
MSRVLEFAEYVKKTGRGTLRGFIAGRGKEPTKSRAELKSMLLTHIMDGRDALGISYDGKAGVFFKIV